MFSDKFCPTSLESLLKMILHHLKHGHLFGIPSPLFFKANPNDPFQSVRYGQLLETPFGVAAGPHTQLSQNIVAAWITGARFIELKTIQTLDELEIPKPCIDMQDEGYNCEWSQELKIGQSFEQYLDAWILIHVLRHKLGVDHSHQPGVIFNMSVGYNLEGIMKDNVQWFLNKMEDATEELQQKIESIKAIYPEAGKLKISQRLSDNVTLSTMHGCPPDEIEKIARYLLAGRKLHTSVKLNPTLLGKDHLHQIMAASGFETQVPDQAFEHDLKYEDALKIIENLQKVADENQRHFGLKLTNTLESVNHKNVFPKEADMMYNSGRSLHPISVNVALKLQKQFEGKLDLSFSGGAHALNISELVKCGLSPITVCTDLLKPGGYSRMHQYVEKLREAFAEKGSSSIDDFIAKGAESGQGAINKHIIGNLEEYAAKTLKSPLYKKQGIHDPSIKTKRQLQYFDCIHAPCVDTCPTHQDIPTYNSYCANGEFKKAARVVMQTNPFPRTTGMICDHLCQLKCTRINYDQPVQIREIKRFVAEAGAGQSEIKSQPLATSKKAAIIGAGPSGLSAARFLAQAGMQVEVFESKPQPGGMVTGVIPPFRLTDDAIESDVNEIEKLGVKLHYQAEIMASSFSKLRDNFEYIYIAAGAQNTSRLNIPGIETPGVIDPLHMLEQVKLGHRPEIGPNVAIIGGGNTAMDAARTALRLAGEGGKVTVVYRRTIKEMPADMGEIKAVIDEGMEIMELTAPLQVSAKDGKVSGLICCKMQLGDKDASGRRKPEKIEGSEFEIPFNTIIPAVGQDLAFDFGHKELLKASQGSYETQIPGVFIGGDAMRGASTAINAIGDGRKVAQIIIDREGIDFNTRPINKREPADLSWHLTQRAKRLPAVKVNETPLSKRLNFDLITSTLTPEEAKKEAARCLLCDEICSICTTVCPNMAFYAYKAEPLKLKMQKIIKQEGEFQLAEGRSFETEQAYQIIHIADWCNRCGNCNTFCPSADAPYEKKPHLYLSQKAYMNEQQGFFMETGKDKMVLHRKTDGQYSSLCSENGTLLYAADHISVTFDANTLRVISYEVTGNLNEVFDLWPAAEMYLIMKGASEFFPHG